MDEIYTRKVARFRKLFEIDDEAKRQAAIDEFFEGEHPEKRPGIAKGLLATFADDFKRMTPKKSEQFTTILKGWFLGDNPDPSK